MPKNELVQIGLELLLAHPTTRADQPLLEISDSAIGKWDSRLRTFTEFRSGRLRSGDVFESGFREAAEDVETIGVDCPARSDVLLRKGMMVWALKIRYHFFIRTRPESAPALFHRDENQRRPSALELPASPETRLLATNLINGNRGISPDMAVCLSPGIRR